MKLIPGKLYRLLDSGAFFVYRSDEDLRSEDGFSKLSKKRYEKGTYFLFIKSVHVPGQQFPNKYIFLDPDGIVVWNGVRTEKLHSYLKERKNNSNEDK